MSRLVVVAIVAVLISACGAALATPANPGSTATNAPATIAPRVPAAPTPSPTPPPAPSPSPTPAPTRPLPAGPLPRVAVVEQDGVRVKIELERNPMPAGEVTRVSTTVRNLGPTTLHWLSDGCSTPVHVSGEMEVAWRPGVTHDGQAELFKELALDWKFRSPPPPGPQIVFRPEEWLGKGSYGCGDVGIVHEIAPGKAVRDVRAWDGMAYLRRGPPPSGPVALTGSFGAYWRGGPMPAYADWPRIELVLEAWVTGGADETWLSPPEVVDAALAHADFVAYLARQDLGSGHAEILWYRPELGAWEVGILDWYDARRPRMHVVVVDPRTGEVREFVHRRWDEEADGGP